MPLIKLNKIDIVKKSANIGMSKNKWLLIICLLLATSLLATGCTKEDQAESSKTESTNKEQIKSQNYLELSNSTDFVPATNNSEVAEIANTISVRIEGATQGSGVLVKRKGNQYTILTSWHVISGTKKGEELDIYTSDGERHQYQQGSIKKIGNVDMATLTFKSKEDYKVATIGNADTISMGESIFVSGFPMTTSAVPIRIIRFLKGDVIANADAVIPKGYQLLYSNKTLPGMSGGSVMNERGRLIGIHGQGEIDSKETIAKGIAVKTGTNQGVPINYYIVIDSEFISKHDDYKLPKIESKEFENLLAEVKSIHSKYNNDLLSLASEPDWMAKRDEYVLKNQDMFKRAMIKSKAALNIRNSKEAYLSVAIAYQIKRFEHLILKLPELGAGNYNEWAEDREQWVKKDNEYKDIMFSNLNAAIGIDPNYIEALQIRGDLKEDNERGSGLDDYERILAVDKNNIKAVQAKTISYFGSIINDDTTFDKEKYEQLLENEYQRLLSIGGDKDIYIGRHVGRRLCLRVYTSKATADWDRQGVTDWRDRRINMTLSKEYDACLDALP